MELGSVSISEVLQAIGEEAGLRVEVHGDLGSVRPQAFDGVPLARGIQRLIGDNQIGLVMLYAPDDAGVKRLAGIRAYEVSEGVMPAGRWMPPSAARLPPPPPPPPPPGLAMPGAG